MGRLQSWLDGDESIAVVPLAAFFPSLSDRVVAAERAIVFASICGQSRIVRLLLDRPVNVNPPRSYWTASPLHTAAIQGQAIVVKLLLQRGADRH